MDRKMGMTINDFAVYSSPRYFRLIFPEIKPKTKNGDLVSALGELKQWQFVSSRSHWDHIRLTEKGKHYKDLITKLLAINALNVPTINGLLDYRSELGRKIIILLIRFLAGKLDFNKFINYLHVPIFDSDGNQEWMKMFDHSQGHPVDYSSSKGRDQMMEFLKNRNRPYQKRTEAIHQLMVKQDTPIVFNQTLIRKFLEKQGMNRPAPLFNHFNSAVPQLFQIRDRKFYVNLAELSKISDILEEHIVDYKTDENQWLIDYFKLLKLPTGKTGLFGFMAGEDVQYASKSDAFLNLAVEGPRIFAGQFSTIEELGDLRQIIFPINPKESLVITCEDLDMLYYFTIDSSKCIFKVTANPISLKNYPEKYITNRGDEFGKLISKSRTLDEAEIIQAIYESTDAGNKKRLQEQLKIKKYQLQQKMNDLSFMSACLISICQMITMKYNQGFGLTKCMAFFSKGYINLVDVGGMDQILTSINIAKIEYGGALKRMMQQIAKSLSELVDLEL